MRNRRNFYRVLQVQPDAQTEVIEASYKTLMQRLRMHPDLGGDHWNATVINEAFATLRDPARRKEYDRTLPNQTRAPRPTPASASVPDTQATPPPEPAAAPPAGTGRSMTEWRAGVNVPRAQPSDAVIPPVVVGTAHTRQARAPVIHASVACAFCGTRHSVRSTETHDARCAGCRSPLYAVPALDTPGNPVSGRAVERIERRLPVHLDVSGASPGSMAAISEDLSVHGMRLLVPIELPIGARLRITCEFCDAVGEVTHVQAPAPAGPAVWRTGVRFLTFSVRQPRGGLVSLKA